LLRNMFYINLKLILNITCTSFGYCRPSREVVPQRKT